MPKLSTFRAEIHIHTVLSPCAAVEMIPPLIIETAVDQGINLIAITDHNATANVEAVMKAAVGTNVSVLGGMEIQTREEVHVICLFPGLDQVNAWQKMVDQALPDLPNNVEFFGEQFVVDQTGDFIRSEPRLLSTSTSLSIEDAYERVHALGGLFIPAHVNRKAYGLIANLGFIPPNIIPDAVEISRHLPVSDAVKNFPQLSAYPIIQSGDVHQLDEFLGYNEFLLFEPTIEELSLALQGSEGRSFRVDPIQTT
ncbi:MAG TPA: PHP domain-containing protein [Longilinea sp.]|nr:PHP domain-containing protein [Longilinea sp.]